MEVKTGSPERAAEKKSLRSLFVREWEKRKADSWALAADVIAVLCTFILTRTHLFFGARPAGIALLACLPHHVFVALFGAVIGGISLGKSGFIYAMASIVTVFLRVVLSDGGERTGKVLFSEHLSLRVSGAVIGGFVAGVYGILLDGLALRSLLYAIGMILGAAGLCLLFSVFFTVRAPLYAFVLGKESLFTPSPGAGRAERVRLVAAELSFGAFLFLIALGLRDVSVLGVSFSYLFCSFATLFVAKRFGAVRAMAAGFLSALGLSAGFAPSFALCGLAAGLLFPLGTGYAILGATAAVAGWTVYAVGAAGLLEVLPEYLCSVLICLPFFRKWKAESGPRVGENAAEARDMVGTMALRQKSRTGDGVDGAIRSLRQIAPLFDRLCKRDAERFGAESERITLDCLGVFCKTCPHFPFCDAGEREAMHRAIAGKVASGEVLSLTDFSSCTGSDADKRTLLDVLSGRIAALGKETVRPGAAEACIAACDLITKLFSEARAADAGRTRTDAAATERLSDAFRKNGFPDGTLLAVGERERTVIAAGRDPDGHLISSPSLLGALESALCYPLSPPTFFRRNDTVLMECHTERKFRVESAVCSLPSLRDGGVSGDSANCFEDGDGRYFTALSDGMGTGNDAREVSSFCVGYLSSVLGAGCRAGTALSLLNVLLRTQKDERFSTVDLMEFDLYSGECLFYKSGAAPSYVVRGKTLFRVRSESAPVGTLDRADPERLRAQVAPGDVIVMVSDGVAASVEDAPWLAEWLTTHSADELSGYADGILRTAAKRAGERRDDMTVVASRILPA